MTIWIRVECLAKYWIQTLFYQAWDDDPDIHVVLMKGAGGKAFCAGGDVRGLLWIVNLTKRS